MTVYVDPLKDWGWRLGPSCHMSADTDEELHEMARRIGMKRSWAQSMDHPRQHFHHYDLVASRRMKAVSLGAVEVSHREWAALAMAPPARKVFRIRVLPEPGPASPEAAKSGAGGPRGGHVASRVERLPRRPTREEPCFIQSQRWPAWCWAWCLARAARKQRLHLPRWPSLLRW